MPIYEYRCAACGHELEMLQKLSEAPLVDCPACGKGALTKLVSAAGFQLKGSGWYATDFKNSGRKPEAKTASKSGDAAPSESKAESKAESKSEAATPAPGAGCGTKCSCH
jgi:putative FmdB family regulatory protein